VEDELHCRVPRFLIILDASQRPNRCHKVFSISIIYDAGIGL
jgi:hypothetical protein